MSENLEAIENLSYLKPLTEEDKEVRNKIVEEIMTTSPETDLLSNDISEWKPAFEPAKEGDELPKEIWIPNRRERRLMKKRGNKAEKALSKFYQNAINEARDYVNTPDYKNEIYKALYEKTKARNEELEKEIAQNGIAANEGN